MLLPVHHHAVRHLIGKDHEAVAAGHFHNLLQNLLRVEGAGGVIGVDDDDGLGAGRDFGLHVGGVRHPVRLLITDIMHGFAAGEGDAGRPHRVVGHGDKDFIPVVDEGVHGELDELTGAVARIDIRHGYVGDVLDLRILHDGLACREEAAGV